MKKTYVAMMMAGLIGTTMAAKPAQAEDSMLGDVSIAGDIGVASQYVWRGVTQTNGKTAVQGDLGVSMGGLSLTGWFSNAYPSPLAKYAPRDVVEFDWTADYSGELGDTGLGYSVGGIYYTYLYDAASNFGEAYLGLSYDMFSVTGYFNLKDSNNKAYKQGDTWVDFGVGGSYGGFDLSGTLSYAKWKKDPVNRPIGAINTYKNGFNLVTLGVSKGFTVADTSLTSSMTVTVPIGSKQSDSNRYIYGVSATNEFVAALSMAY